MPPFDRSNRDGNSFCCNNKRDNRRLENRRRKKVQLNSWYSSDVIRRVPNTYVCVLTLQYNNKVRATTSAATTFLWPARPTARCVYCFREMKYDSKTPGDKTT